MNIRAQGALEYLIIVAAVLAIAAVVVVIVSGAFAGGSGSAEISAMKQDATDCAQALVAEGLEPGSPNLANHWNDVVLPACEPYCSGESNPRWQNWEDKVKLTQEAQDLGLSSAQSACYAGMPSWIVAGKTEGGGGAPQPPIQD